MEDLLPTNPNLPPNFIDCSIGEPYVIRNALLKNFNISNFEIPKEDSFWNYPNPIGYSKLIQILEDKYQSPIVITNGAKQGLAASFYAIHKLGYDKIALRAPFWCLMPPLINMNELQCEYKNFDETKLPYLLVTPSNPDGFIPDEIQMQKICDDKLYNNRPIIADCAYYTSTYLPAGYQTQNFGDVQIFSSSKMLGLPSLRVGFCVCHDPVFYDLIRKYVDHMTVGVSMIAQTFLYNILLDMKSFKSSTKGFEEDAHGALSQSRRIVSQINPEVLEVPAGFETSSGMFAFLKVGVKADFTKARVNVSPGELYGMPGYVRMNLALPAETMQEVVLRLNSVM